MVPALIVGALTAWYLGVRAGIVAAGVTFGALLVATFVPIPGVSLAVYALILAWCGALYFLGPKLGAKQGSPLGSGLGAVTGQASAWIRKLIQKSK